MSHRFKKETSDFRTASFIFSVVDHLVQETGHVGAFISQDGVFSDPRVLDHAKVAGVSIQIYSSIEEVYKELDNRLELAIKRAWDEDRKHAEDALMKRISDIQKFVSENFEISENDLGFGGRILSVRNLDVQRVRNVQTPFLLDRKENEPVKISFEIELAATVEVERSYIPPIPSRLKVGQEMPRLETRSLREVLAGPTQEERVLPWIAEAEATVPPDDKEYRNIQFLSVRSKAPNFALMLERALAAPSK